MNIIKTLNLFYKEDIISDLLVSCLNDNKSFITDFLKQANIDLEIYNYEIQTRISLGKGIGVPDIVIYIKASDGEHIVVIENKLGADEGYSQTERYATKIARKKLKDRFKTQNAHFHYIYLALDTTSNPTYSEYKIVNYNTFLNRKWKINNEKLKVIFKDFIECLNDFYEPLKSPLKSIENDKLESIQKIICWYSVLNNITKNYQNLIIVSGKVGGSGRLNFLYRIDKDSWKSKNVFQNTGLSKTFNIHIDTYIDLLSDNQRTLKEINVRFETNPYTPRKNIINDIQYKDFLNQKMIFSNYVSEFLSQYDLQFSIKNFALIALNIPLNQSSTQKSITDYKKKLNIIIKAVDYAVNRMYQN